MKSKEKIRRALCIIARYGGIDGSHHKQWVLDQVVRQLTDDYHGWITAYEAGEDGPLIYEWDVGIPP